MILGVPWGFAVELAEVTDILEGHRRVTESFVLGVDRLCAGEMEHDQSSIEAWPFESTDRLRLGQIGPADRNA